MKPTVSRSQASSSARCPRCGRSFDCAAHAEPGACWCAAMPALPADALKPGSRCLCPECLADAVARAQAGEAGASRAAGEVRVSREIQKIR